MRDYRNIFNKVVPYHTDNSMSLYEFVGRLYEYLKDFEGSLDEAHKRIDEFIQKFGTDLSDTTKDLLTEWHDDGTLAELINLVWAEKADKHYVDNLINRTANTLTDNYTQADEDLRDQLTDGYTQEIARVDAHLAHNAEHLGDMVSVLKYNPVSDGSLDTTQQLQQAINENNHIYIPDGIYLFSRLHINGQKKIVFGENVTLKSNHTINDATQGYIDIRGEMSGILHQIIGDIKTLQNQFRVSPTHAGYYKTGDVIELTQDRAYLADSEVTTEAEHIQQHAYAILTVKDVNTTTGVITTHETIPYDFQVVYNPMVQKVLAVANVELIGSNTRFDLMGQTSHGNFINVALATNARISGFQFYNGAGKGVEFYKVNRFFISDVVYRNPTTQTSAKGEAFMLNKSGFGLIERAYIYDSRRGVDFTNSWNCIVRNSMAMQGRFTTHGLLSKFITFDNCVVYGRPKEITNYYGFTVGNNDYMFDQDIVFVNCSVYGGFYGLHATANSKNIHVDNCYFHDNVNAIAMDNTTNVTIVNTKIYNCDVDISIIDSKNCVLTGLIILNEMYTTGTNGCIRVLGGCEDVVFDNIILHKNMSNLFNLAITTPKANLKIRNSELKSLQQGNLYIGDVKGIDIFNCETTQNLRLSGKENISVRNSTFPRWMYGTDNDPIRNFILKDNIVTDTTFVPPHLPTNNMLNIYNEGNIFLVE